MSDQAQQAAIGDDTIAASEAITLWGLFRERVRRSPDAIAYRDYDHAKASWRDHSWKMISERVEQFRAAFARVNLKPGDRVAILLPNGIDWACLDMAAHGLGLIVVGLYPHDTAASNAYILGHSDARLVILDSKARWASIWSFRSEFPSLEHVWVNDSERGPAAQLPGPAVRQFADVLAEISEPLPPLSAKANDIATLIYTSGTTGRPKGVMLSHFALLGMRKQSAAWYRRDGTIHSCQSCRCRTPSSEQSATTFP
jgi:long-chain acyl-CoA synthetase